MFKIGVMASGTGSNFKALIDNIGEGNLECQCKFLITNNATCKATEYASEYGVPIYHISKKTHPIELDYENALCKVLEDVPVDLVILAGYMKRLPDIFIKRMPNRILNIHPSLLPKYGGKGFYGIHVHEAVIKAKDSESGVTVHLVTGEFDTGKILAQVKVPVELNDNSQTLAKRVLQEEHKLYWQVIQNYAKSFLLEKSYEI